MTSSPLKKSFGKVSIALLAVAVCAAGCESELDRRVRATLGRLRHSDGADQRKARAAVTRWASGDLGKPLLVLARQHGTGRKKWLKVEWVADAFAVDSIRIFGGGGDRVDLPILEKHLHRSFETPVDRDNLYLEVGLEGIEGEPELRSRQAALMSRGTEVSERVTIE